VAGPLPGFRTSWGRNHANRGRFGRCARSRSAGLGAPPGVRPASHFSVIVPWLPPSFFVAGPPPRWVARRPLGEITRQEEAGAGPATTADQGGCGGQTRAEGRGGTRFRANFRPLPLLPARTQRLGRRLPVPVPPPTPPRPAARRKLIGIVPAPNPRDPHVQDAAASLEGVPRPAVRHSRIGARFGAPSPDHRASPRLGRGARSAVLASRPQFITPASA